MNRACAAPGAVEGQDGESLHRGGERRPELRLESRRHARLLAGRFVEQRVYHDSPRATARTDLPPRSAAIWIAAALVEFRDRPGSGRFLAWTEADHGKNASSRNTRAGTIIKARERLECATEDTGVPPVQSGMPESGPGMCEPAGRRTFATGGRNNSA